ncbi:unnamed protein product, partial [Symbiodinium sp. CCMP2456]
MPATTRLLVEAVLVGLKAVAASRPLRRFMTLSEVQSENAWREKFRFKSFAFHVFAPATTCRLCIAESLDFAVDIFPETRSSVLDEIDQLDLLELLIFLWGYNFDLRQMVEYRFFHDCHLGNILVLPVTAGSKSGPPRGKTLRFAWHDFGSHSFHSSPSGDELQKFANKYDEAMNATVRRLGNLNPKLERTLEQVQNAIMKWRDPDAGRIQSTMMQMWIWSGDSRARISELQELAPISSAVTTSTSSVVWVRELIRKGLAPGSTGYAIVFNRAALQINIQSVLDTLGLTYVQGLLREGKLHIAFLQADRALPAALEIASEARAEASEARAEAIEARVK